MNARIKKLTESFIPNDIEAVLITNDINITYLTGFPASESWLLLGRNCGYYITDFRYIHEARKGLKGIKVKQYAKSVYDTVFELAKRMSVKRIGIDARHLTLEQYQKLKCASPEGVQLVQIEGLVERLREIKDAGEIHKIKKALKVHKQAQQYLKRIIRPGMAEKDVLLKLEYFVKSKGAGFSFDPIIASGENSSYPHARVTDRKIRANQPLLIDMGIDVEGYKSDLTRMFFLGKIPALVRQVHDLVFEAQQRAVTRIKAGVSAAEIDYQARNYLAKNKLAKYFGHALGHGVGLEIHEGPRLAAHNSSILREGMIITVEPAVYIPHQFGIRIEDMVLVKKNDCEILSDDIH